MRIHARDQILGILVSAARYGMVSVGIESIARRCGLSLSSIHHYLSKLDADGLIDRWTNERGKDSACLTSWAIGLFDVKIGERHRKRKRRPDAWHTTEADLDESDTLDGVRVYDLADVPDDSIELHLPDHPGMDDWTEDQKDRGRRSDYSSGRIPAPELLVGISPIWPLPPADDVCPTCLDDPPFRALCLVCHRYPLADVMLGLAGARKEARREYARQYRERKRQEAAQASPKANASRSGG